VRVLKAMAQSCDLVRYYITFETEILTCGGSQSQTKIYRALVRWSRPPIDDDNFSVLSMREYKKDRADQVIGIHSLSELDARLDAASMTSRLAILYFSETHRCRFISPLYTSLSGKYPTVVFLKVDIAEASNVAARWNIRSAPYFFFLKNGEVVDKVVGVGGTEDILKRKIARHSRKQASKLEVS
jgi:thiol-disulfide isomerase/thioredoxin